MGRLQEEGLLALAGGSSGSERRHWRRSPTYRGYWGPEPDPGRTLYERLLDRSARARRLNATLLRVGRRLLIP